MLSPLERLTKIIDSYVPSEIVFRAFETQNDKLTLNAVMINQHYWKTNSEDADLQLILTEKIHEQWNHELFNYCIRTSVDDLWQVIKSDIVREYELISPRCTATKRKTTNFIQGINIKDKHLPNYLINIFLTIASEAYENKSQSKQEALFEQFESLRKTYGK